MCKSAWHDIRRFIDSRFTTFNVNYVMTMKGSGYYPDVSGNLAVWILKGDRVIDRSRQNGPNFRPP